MADMGIYVRHDRLLQGLTSSSCVGNVCHVSGCQHVILLHKHTAMWCKIWLSYSSSIHTCMRSWSSYMWGICLGIHVYCHTDMHWLSKLANNDSKRRWPFLRLQLFVKDYRLETTPLYRVLSECIPHLGTGLPPWGLILELDCESRTGTAMPPGVILSTRSLIPSSVVSNNHCLLCGGPERFAFVCPLA